MELKTAKVLGYSVNLQTFEEAISIVKSNLINNIGMHIITINPEIIELANKDINVEKVLKSADFVVPDGVGIKIALKLKGIKQEQIAGIDFAKELLNICAKENKTVAMIGAKEDIIQKAVINLKEEIKNINIGYYRNGYFNNNEEDRIINELIEAEPNFILIALGAPKQDYFINKCKELLPNAIFIGVGGSFDVWAGVVERAPKFFRMICCEWLYRTIKQPERFKRIYKTLPLFLFKAIIDATKCSGKCV